MGFTSTVLSRPLYYGLQNFHFRITNNKFSSDHPVTRRSDLKIELGSRLGHFIPASQDLYNTHQIKNASDKQSG